MQNARLHVQRDTSNFGRWEEIAIFVYIKYMSFWTTMQESNVTISGITGHWLLVIARFKRILLKYKIIASALEVNPGRFLYARNSKRKDGQIY